MKLKPAYTTILFFILLLTSGCKKNFVPNLEQDLYFQMDFINYAWGYQHYGYLIDSEGNVLTYDNPSDWNFPGDGLTLTHEQVSENISLCSQSGIRIPESELKKFASYIDNIASSRITAPKPTAADAGSTEFICYSFAANSNIYRGSLIKMEGDYSCENLNFYSKRVIAWMKQISNNLSVN